MKRLVFLVAFLALTPRAEAWWGAIGTIKGEQLGAAEMGRLTCALVEKYGPSRSYYKLSIEIPASPYGHIDLNMGPQLWMDVGLKTEHEPSEAVRTEILAWLVAHVPATPKPCTFLLASQGWLGRVGYPDVPAPVAEEEYITIQLDLAFQATTREPDAAWRWADGALAAFRGLDHKKQRKFIRDPRLRAAAYAVVEHDAPDGLSEIGKRSYCMFYDHVRTLFKPASSRERRVLDRARRTLACR